ncbi:MAG: 3-oxoacyl-[acyl-carrier protein] reductase, partial [Myxococcota bacterium]
MSDYLVELAKNPQVRNLVKNMGLPVPMPQDLRRPKQPRGDRDLADRVVGLFIAQSSPLSEVLARTLAVGGASMRVASAEGAPAVFAEQAEAWARPLAEEAVVLDVDDDEKVKYDALVFDATGLGSAGQLRQLYDYFHPRLRSLARNGRIVVIGRDPARQTTPGAAAAQAALDGFARSIAKEVGAKGSTAQLLTVAAGAEAQVAGPLRFFLGSQSTYV